MDYRAAKRGLSEMVSDLIKSPIKVGGVLIFLLILSLTHDAASSYVSNWVIQDDVVANEKSAPSIAIQNGTTSGMVLTPTLIKEDTKKYLIEVDYPVFNIQTLDEQVKHILESHISEFKFAHRDETYKAGLGMHYDTPFINSEIISFKMTRCVYVVFEEGGGRCLHGAISVNYDREENRILTLDDALKLIGMDLEELADETIKQFAKNGDEFTKTIMYKEGVAPYPQNFSVFLINDKEVTFLFEQGQLFAMVAGVPEVKFTRID